MTQWRPWTPAGRRRQRRLFSVPEMKDLRAKSAFDPPASSTLDHAARDTLGNVAWPPPPLIQNTLYTTHNTVSRSIFRQSPPQPAPSQFPTPHRPPQQFPPLDNCVVPSIAHFLSLIHSHSVFLSLTSSLFITRVSISPTVARLSVPLSHSSAHRLSFTRLLTSSFSLSKSL